jgi:peptidoglycan/LPS O-acetylase OafA/YrhL
MSRLTGLDALRGIAALMIFVTHVQLPGMHPATVGLDAGVLIFFSLSGYLLYAPFAAARERGERIDLRTYAIRRVARIVPAYLVAAFGIALIWYPWLLSDPIGIALGTRTPILVVWTLQIEVEFYVLLPVLAWVMSLVATSRRTLALLFLAAGSMVATVVIMAVEIQLTGGVPPTDLLTVASFLWAFVPGMLVAEFQQRGTLNRPVDAIVAIVGLVLIGISVVIDLPPYFDIAAAAGSGLLVATIVSRRSIEARFGRASIVLGALSYSVYLWHETIIGLVDRPTPTWIGAILALAITVAIAAVAYVVVEAPAIRLGHRLVLARRRRVAIRESAPAIPADVGDVAGAQA